MNTGRASAPPAVFPDGTGTGKRFAVFLIIIRLIFIIEFQTIVFIFFSKNLDAHLGFFNFQLSIGKIILKLFTRGFN